MKNTFDIQSPKLEEDTEEVIKLWFAEKKLSPPSKTWRLYVAESKYVSNMVSTVRSIRKKWLWILMKRVPNRRKRESQIGGREKCDFCVYNMEEKLVFLVHTCYLCVSDSNDVPNLVVTMHFRQEKRLERRIFFSHIYLARVTKLMTKSFGFCASARLATGNDWKQKK